MMNTSKLIGVLFVCMLTGMLSSAIGHSSSYSQEDEQVRIKEIVIKTKWKATELRLDRVLEALTELSLYHDQKQRGARIVTDFEFGEHNPKISFLAADGKTVEQHLDEIMKQSGCSYYFRDLTIVVTLAPKVSEHAE